MLFVQVPVWCPRTAVSRGAPQEGLQWKQIFHPSKIFAVKTVPQNTKNLYLKKNWPPQTILQLNTDNRQTVGLPWSETKVLGYKHLWYDTDVAVHCTLQLPRCKTQQMRTGWSTNLRGSHHSLMSTSVGGGVGEKIFCRIKNYNNAHVVVCMIRLMCENAMNFKKVIVERVPA